MYGFVKEGDKLYYNIDYWNEYIREELKNGFELGKDSQDIYSQLVIAVSALKKLEIMSNFVICY